VNGYLDISRLLTDATFQKEIIRTTKDHQTREFFEHEYPAYPKGAYLPITSRLGMFTRREPIRNLLCQPGQSFNFRKAMDEGKILLFNLSDSLLGQQAAQILGQIIVSKLQLAVMSRADTPAAARRPFYLYLDEFQAFTGVNEDSYEMILSRARKYRLGLILAHQQTHQLSSDLLHAILGNVATIITFGVSRADADKLAREYLLDTGGEMLEMPSEELLRLKVGEAWGKIGQGIFPLKTFLVDQKPDYRRAQYTDFSDL
jgi:type IV secretory pathway TraG/TraD family ATPase VirD4